MYSRKFALAAVSAIVFSIGASAQTTTGDLVGVVKDATGAVLPRAAITVKNEETGVTTNTTAGAAGEYRVNNLPAGRYDITATVSGFQPSSLKGINVALNATATADVAMSVSTSATVEVSTDAGAAVLDTTSVNLTQTFGNQELSELATTSVGLGVINASLLSPGVASAGGIGIGIGPSVGGQRPRNNNFTIEGIDNNNKAVTGPLVYVPNDAVGNFTLITNQFSPEFGHSSGGQFNSTVVSGTNTFHGRVYEYFQNRNLNAEAGVQGGKPAINPRFDDNRYGGQIGGPILRNRLFFFGNFEKLAIGQSLNSNVCTPTAAGLATLNSLGASYGFNANNLAQYEANVPAANLTGAGGAGIDASKDVACFNQSAGAQFLTVFQGTTLTNKVYGSGVSTQIPLGNYHIAAPTFSNQYALATSLDYTVTSKDSIRARYIYNRLGSEDTAAALPAFYVTNPFRFNLISISEYHSFTSNLTNEFRIGFNRYSNTTVSGTASYPGLDSFPNLTFYDQAGLNVGPDPNAPQFTIQNLYQAVDNVSYVKGKNTFAFGFDGRKYISPQGFTQRARGDYQWNALTEFLHDLAPTNFGERSTGNKTYYGDQTALYGYGNDTYRVLPTLTFNFGLRYEFTSVPVGERAQALNSAASVAGLINFSQPKPAYKNFAPRVGINWAPDEKTSIRAAFGMAYDVLFDNLGTLSNPPQYSSTNDVGQNGNKNPGDPNFLAQGGLPPGAGGLATFATIGAQRAATSAYVPDQVTPYAETYTLTIQRNITHNYTAEVGYIGTRGIHLPTQVQLNVQPRVTAANALPTYFSGVAINPNGPTFVATGLGVQTLGQITALSNIVPAYLAAGFTGKITSYQPFSSSNYNGLVANLTRRFQNGLQANVSYTWSKTMDDATAEVFATTLTPRREQNSQNIAGDYSRSALDRTHRFTAELLYDLQVYKHSNSFILKNLVGNWTISPIYTYESPEYATVLSGDNANLNGDSAATIDRTIVNPNVAKARTSSTVVPIYSQQLAGLCTGTSTACDANTVGYAVVNPSAYYIQAGRGTLPNAPRNSLSTSPTNNLDASIYKRLTVFDHYSLELGLQAFNVVNHAQYTPGTVDNVNQTSQLSQNLPFQTVGTASFGLPGKVFFNNPRSMQVSGKIIF